MKYSILLIFFLLTSCVTVVNRKLPELKAKNFAQDKLIKVTFSNEMMDFDKEFVLQALHESKVNFINVKNNKDYLSFKPDEDISTFDDFKPIKAKTQNYDYEFQVVWKTYGHYEPYCIVFLTIIPCTPPMKWLVGIRVKDNKGNIIKDYMVKEDAFEIYWVFGLLHKPDVPDGDVRRDLLRNAFTNILDNIQKDGYI